MSRKARFEYLFSSQAKPVARKARPGQSPRAKALRAWKPGTKEGRSCKAAFLRYEREGPSAPFRGVYNYSYGRLCPVNDPTMIADWYRLGLDKLDVAA